MGGTTVRPVFDAFSDCSASAAADSPEETDWPERGFTIESMVVNNGWIITIDNGK